MKKSALLKIITFLFKVLKKVLIILFKIFIELPFIAYRLGMTFDTRELEEFTEKI